MLGSAALDNNLVSLYPRAYTGPIVLEFADDGSGNGAYYDESTKTWLKIGAASSRARARAHPPREREPFHRSGLPVGAEQITAASRRWTPRR